METLQTLTLPKVGVIIVAYQDANELRSALESVERQSYPNVTTVVVDSSDPPLNLQATTINQAHFLTLGKNVGYAAAANVGIRRLEREGGIDYYFLMNDDVVLRPDCIERLVGAVSPFPLLAAGGPVILTPKHAIASAGGDIDMARGVSRPNRLKRWNQPGETAYGTQFLSGAALLISSSAWKRVGPFDEGMFMYCDETDWEIRALKIGLTLMIVPSATAIHSGSPDDEKLKPFAVFWTHCNSLKITRRYGSGRDKAVLPFTLLEYFGYYLKYLVQERDHLPLVAFFRGLAHGFVNVLIEIGGLLHAESRS